MTQFALQVTEIVKNIPKGSVLTYSQVAALVGNPKASRAVGSVMAKNTDKSVPCHRVVKSDGTIGAYNLLQGASKSDLLIQEGVSFESPLKVILHK
jgi:O-6-methylguanine DNA methyltransferase